MEIDFLKALRDVLEDIVRIGKVYERNKTDEIAPLYGRTIFSLLKEKNCYSYNRRTYNKA